MIISLSTLSAENEMDIRRGEAAMFRIITNNIARVDIVCTAGEVEINSGSTGAFADNGASFL